MENKSRSRLAYEYYMGNEVTKADACKKFGIDISAIGTYMRRHNLPDKIIHNRSKVAYEYYMANDVSKAEACRKFALHFTSMFRFMCKHKLPDKKKSNNIKGG